MKLTRRQLSMLVRQHLTESREIKQQFYDQVRAKHPDIDNSFFVTWWGDGYHKYTYNKHTKGRKKEFVPSWEFLDTWLTEFLPKVNSSATFDIPCNLTDPSGKDIAPHGGTWGSIGFVFQGISTLGYNNDMGTSKEGSEDQHSPRTRMRVEDEYLNNEYSPFRDLYSKELHDVRVEDPDEPYGYSTKKVQGPTEIVFDEEKDQPFLSHQERFTYSWNEFGVVPKKPIAIVYHNDIEFIKRENIGDEPEWATLVDEEVDPVYAGEQIRKVATKFGLRSAIGPKEIGKLYRQLYASEK